MIFEKIRGLRRPEIYQGHGQRAPYFEGWYFKLITADHAHAVAVIPGVAFSGKRRHAFIQVADSVTRESQYYEYDISHFYASRDRFEVRISGSVFSDKDISLNTWQGTHRIQGAIRFENTTPFPVTLISPGIMGWYAYVPFMECYHGVVSMNHRLYGTLSINGRNYDFNHGKGYIEKDWGRSFPKEWIWLQSNLFEEPSASFMLSVAKIPWLSRHFTGFLGFLSVRGKLYRFATYTGAKIVSLSHESSRVRIVLRDKRHQLEVTALCRPENDAFLVAPVNGGMDRGIKESVDSEIDLVLTDVAGKVLFRGKGLRGVMEVQGEVQ